MSHLSYKKIQLIFSEHHGRKRNGLCTITKYAAIQYQNDYLLVDGNAQTQSASLDDCISMCTDHSEPCYSVTFYPTDGKCGLHSSIMTNSLGGGMMPQASSIYATIECGKRPLHNLSVRTSLLENLMAQPFLYKM